MSKTSQRKVSKKAYREATFKQGYSDALEGNYFRWCVHPHMGAYRAGFRKALSKKGLYDPNFPLRIQST